MPVFPICEPTTGPVDLTPTATNNISPSINVSAGDQLILDGTCTGGDPPVTAQWYRTNLTGPATPIVTPYTVTALDNGLTIYLVCTDVDGDMATSTPTTLVVGSVTSNNLGEVPVTFNGTTQDVEVCSDCVGATLWQASIDEPLLTQPDYNLPAGYDPDPDQPTPTSAWQTQPTTDPCITLRIEQDLIDGLTSEPDDGQLFYLNLRASCDGGATFDQGRLVVRAPI